MRMTSNEEVIWIGGGLILLMILASVCSWFNHLYICFTTEAWGLLIAGAILFPIGILHGFGNFLGIW